MHDFRFLATKALTDLTALIPPDKASIATAIFTRHAHQSWESTHRAFCEIDRFLNPPPSIIIHEPEHDNP